MTYNPWNRDPWKCDCKHCSGEVEIPFVPFKVNKIRIPNPFKKWGKLPVLGYDFKGLDGAQCTFVIPPTWRIEDALPINDG